MSFLLRVLVNAAALAVAVWALPGLAVTGDDTGDQALTLVLVAALFGVVNAFVRPLAALLALPLYVLTLGLVAFVINALMLLLTSWLAGVLGLGFTVDGFWWALLGALVVGFVSWLIGTVVKD